jgi:hypothetical protein
MNKPMLVLVIRCLLLAALALCVYRNPELVGCCAVGLIVPALGAFGNVYSATAVQFGTSPATLLSNTPDSATDWTGGTESPFSGNPPARCFCYDRKNDNIYYSGGTTIIRRTSDYTSSTTTTIVTAPQNVAAIDCDPTNSRLFYIAEASGGNFDLRKVNYDGTGDSSILTWSGGGYQSRDIDVRYDATTDRIYFIKALDPSNVSELRYITPSGASNTLIRSRPGGFGSITAGGQISSIAIDVTNGYLFWTEFTTTDSSLNKLQRSNMNGGSLTTLLADGNIGGLSISSGGAKIAYSQSQAKLYIDLPTTAVVKRMNNDGTSLESLGIPKNWPTVGGFGGPVSQMFALGTGFETIGASAIL